jgi:solute carrier family 25 phosphate transporter 23/24/25/41
MIESGQLPNIVEELCSAIRTESRVDTAQRGLGVAAAALTDTALSSVIAETDITSVSIFGSMIAGGVAGAISRTATAPLERLALLMQVTKMERSLSKGTSKSAYQGVLHGLRNMYAEGGVRSFFWGNGINISRLVPQRGISFTLFEQWKEYNRKRKENGPDGIASTSPDGIYTLALGGALSTAVAGAICYPLDVLRTRVTVQRGRNKDVSVRSIIRNITSVRQLYQGFTPTMIKNIPEWGMNFALFEVLRRTFVDNASIDGTISDDDQYRTLRLLACGAVTSLVSQTVVYPLETLRRNMQIAMWSRSKAMVGTISGTTAALGDAAPTMVSTATSIYSRRGWRGFYSGLAPTYLRVVPATASGFAVYHALLEGFR